MDQLDAVILNQGISDYSPYPTTTTKGHLPMSKTFWWSELGLRKDEAESS